jgi:hypothetical protein
MTTIIVFSRCGGLTARSTCCTIEQARPKETAAAFRTSWPSGLSTQPRTRLLAHPGVQLTHQNRAETRVTSGLEWRALGG